LCLSSTSSTYLFKPLGAGDDGSFDASVHRDHIFGQHVANYMEQLESADDDGAAYKRQFGQYIKHGITHDTIEDMYLKAHQAIRDDPSPSPKSDKVVKAKRWNRAKMSKAQKMDRVRQLKANFIANLAKDE